MILDAFTLSQIWYLRWRVARNAWATPILPVRMIFKAIHAKDGLICIFSADRVQTWSEQGLFAVTSFIIKFLCAEVSSHKLNLLISSGVQVWSIDAKNDWRRITGQIDAWLTTNTVTYFNAPGLAGPNALI